MPNSAHKALTFVSGWPIAAMASRSLAGVILKGAPPCRPRARPFHNELPLKLRQRGKNPEDQFAGRRRGVERCAMPIHDFETNALDGEVVDGINQMPQVAAHAVELPDDQHIPVLPEYW